MALKIQVFGDSYMPVSTFRRAFQALGREHEIEYTQLDETATFVPESTSELRIREYAGTPAQLTDAIGDAEVLVVHGAPVTAEVLAAAVNLRVVGCARGGPVNVDVAAVEARDLTLINTPGKNAEAVAEQTLAFLIMLARRIPKACEFLLDGNHVGESAFEGAEFFGRELGGHVLGLVGYGHVGTRVATRARAFNMSVNVFDPYVRVEQNSGVVQVENLSALLADADFVSLHARAANGDEPLIGAPELASMKPGSYLINTARDSLLDEKALELALASGRLSGAALDVVKPRAEDGRHPLLCHDNVIITPHIGGATDETLLRGASMIADEIERFAAGESLRYALHLPSSTSA